jgi:hypothetical protein
MITRRTVLSAGLALTAAACTAAIGAEYPIKRKRLKARAIDALLIDETIEIPGEMSEIIEISRRTFPVIGIQLDAASHAALLSVLTKSQAIVGVSSGATLFCLERMAWDHGLRLTERLQRCSSDLGDNPCWRDIDYLLSAAHPLATSHSPVLRAYRPSRVDGTLHFWTMQKYADSQPNNYGQQKV